MKKSIFLFVFPIILYAQITTTKVASPNEIPLTRYDSTKNYLAEDAYAYLNQELYLPQKNEKLRKYGWEDFDDDYPTKNIWGNYDYDDLVDKYYLVIKIEKASYSYNDFIFTLKEKSKDDIYYFQYSTLYEHKFPFIVVAYFNKMKNNYIGKNYIVRGKTGLKDGPVVDVNTGKLVDFTNGSEWKCVDLTLDSEYYALCLKLENKKQEIVLMTLRYADRLDWIIPEDRAIYFQKKYGNELWLKALSGKAKIGMTKELCEVAWGKPREINKTIVSDLIKEQWVYGDNSSYLYFDNDLLTAIQ